MTKPVNKQSIGDVNNSTVTNCNNITININVVVNGGSDLALLDSVFERLSAAVGSSRVHTTLCLKH